jgi:hypothetical protein
MQCNRCWKKYEGQTDRSRYAGTPGKPLLLVQDPPFPEGAILICPQCKDAEVRDSKRHRFRTLPMLLTEVITYGISRIVVT